MSFFTRIAALFSKDKLERELDDELRSHLEMRAADNEDRGMSAEEARADAVRRFGNVTLLKEETRSFDIAAWLESLWQDVRYGARMLRKAPGFAAVAILTLAVGMGANVAIFSIVNSVLLRPPAYPHPERLMMLWSTSNKLEKYGSSPADIYEWRTRNHVFENMGWFSFRSFNFSAPGQEPERIVAAEVSASQFDVLGVSPILGRGFNATDEEFGKHYSVLLSYGLWQRKFGGDPNILGRTLKLSSEPYTVVGVMPRGIPFMDNSSHADLYVPMSFKPKDPMAGRGNHWVDVVGRLAPGVTPGQAAAEMSVIAAQLERQFPENAGMGVKVVPLEKELVGETQSTLLVLLGAVGFVLLIACVNVGSLMLARAARRQREMAVRVALGARRNRVLRQLLTESLLLSLLGSGAGLLLAYWAISAMLAFLPETLPRFNPVSIDRNVLLFVCGMSFLTALIFGLAPAVQSWHGDVAGRLKESGNTVTLDRRGKRLRALLMTGELALAGLLLVCAGLTVKSLYRLLRVDSGFEAHNVLTFAVPLYSAGESEPTTRAVQMHNQIVARLRSLPGVEAAAYSTELPLGFGGGWGKLVSFPGRPVPASRADVPDSTFQLVGPEYFRALGTPLLNGRAFTDFDTATSPQVAIVNRAFVRRFFGGEDPIGKTLVMDAPPGLVSTHDPGADQAPVRQIVGVVSDIKDGNGLTEPAPPRVFVPVTQFKGEGGFVTGQYVLRIHGDVMAAVPAIRSVVHEFDREVPMANVRTLEELVRRSAATQRYTTLLLMLFAAVALFMAAIGTYGVISNTVASRTREIGVRVALGASRNNVIRMVLADAARVAVAGTGLALLLAQIAGRAMRSLLFQVQPGDPLALVGVTAVLFLTALIAGYIPARRATTVDPVIALRNE
jgi:putative ABC transport system permease protein